MSQIRRFITTVALALCAILPTGAMAQNVLVLTTKETEGHYTGAISRIQSSLAYAGATVTIGESLTTDDISGTNFSAYDFVVVATGQGAIREDSPGPGAITNFTTLENRIKNYPTPAFIILSDGCNSCVSGSNDALGQFLRIVNEATNDPGMQLSYTPNATFYDPEASQPPAQLPVRSPTLPFLPV